MKLTLCFFALVFSCADKENPKPITLLSCPPPENVISFFQGALKTKVQVADLKTKGSLCAYKLLLGEEARAVRVYYAEGVYVVGIGIREKDGKPFPEEVEHEKTDNTTKP